MGRMSGKVAFITGAARGQGRSHAVRLAEEGADIIAVDICAQMESVKYPMGTREDLEETARAVKACGRQVVTAQADVRDQAALQEVLHEGVAALGGVDIVCANAGVSTMNVTDADPVRAFRDTIDVDLIGVWNTVRVTAPTMIEAGRGGSIVITGSSAGLKGYGVGPSAGFEAYTASKHAVVGLTRAFANQLAEHNIRVNSVHPTGVATPMVLNEPFAALFEVFPDFGTAMSNALPVPMIESLDVSNAIVWLCSEEARYVTGVALPVDAGVSNR